jgi:hypothetical protein
VPSHLVVAARTAGIAPPIDSVYPHINDGDGLCECPCPQALPPNTGLMSPVRRGDHYSIHAEPLASNTIRRLDGEIFVVSLVFPPQRVAGTPQIDRIDDSYALDPSTLPREFSFS